MRQVTPIFKIIFLYCFPFLCIAFLSVSCKKKDTKCKGIIIVNDTTGAFIRDARVHLYATLTGGGTGDVTMDGVTDGNGKFNFELKLQGVFNVDIIKGTSAGSGVIKLEPGETVEKKIRIR